MKSVHRLEVTESRTFILWTRCC